MGTATHCLFHILLFGVVCQHHDSYLWHGGAKERKQCHSADAGQGDVQHDYVGALGDCGLQSMAPVAIVANQITLHGKDAAHCLSHGCGIFYKQNSRTH